MIESIGERIKARRKLFGLSVDDLAITIGKNRATIYRYESNEIENMSITILEPLAKALHTTPAELCGWNSLPPGAILSETEMKLLDDFRQLTQEGKNIVTSTTTGLANNPKYNLKTQTTNTTQPSTEEVPLPEETAASSA